MSDDNDSQPFTSDCFVYETPKIISVWSVSVKTLLLLPLCLSILYISFQQWWRRRGRTLSQSSCHADFFTYHLVLLELMGILGTSVTVAGVRFENWLLVLTGILLGSVNLPGELLILSLTGVDRYLAVVHPVTYLQLRNTNGVRARNVTVAIVWTVCFGFIGFTRLHFPNIPVVEFICLLTVTVSVVSFCSAAVLQALIRPGPGDSHGSGVLNDQTKRKAFKVMVAIVLVQMLWLSGLLLCVSVQKVELLSRRKKCLLQATVSWFNIPCSLVLPVLFLQKKRSRRL